MYQISTVWHHDTPFLIFFSFLDVTRSVTDHMTQISGGFLRDRKVKVTGFSLVLVIFYKVLIISIFYAN